MDIAYYPGCTLQSSSKIYDVQVRLIFEELGIHLHELEDWNCCGATSASKTDDFLAIAMPARNLGIADEMGLDKLLIPCSACYSRMLVAQQQLLMDDRLKNEINAELKKKFTGRIKIVSITELLCDLLEVRPIRKKLHRKLRTLKPVCYYGCMQTRFPLKIPVADDVENPQGMERIMRATGARPLDWAYKTDCCGASASVNDPDMALELMSKILKDAIARGADCFVTSCPMCQFNLDAYQEKVAKAYNISKKLPVYFITEMVGLALGKTPEELQIDRHFVDGIELLKELPLL
ncbi:MAG TPA: CoB--CoM heterodisulfide reductase [Deltaproteobacteria bacterium]|nr:CoB--CoM heterodisulfide reductase [Deltaproteobacteria bacterium]